MADLQETAYLALCFQPAFTKSFASCLNCCLVGPFAHLEARPKKHRSLRWCNWPLAGAVGALFDITKGTNRKGNAVKGRKEWIFSVDTFDAHITVYSDFCTILQKKKIHQNVHSCSRTSLVSRALVGVWSAPKHGSDGLACLS